MEQIEKDILIAICCGDDAKSLTEIVEITPLPLQDVVKTVDSLVEQNILIGDNINTTFYYAFSTSDEAQEAYQSLQKQCSYPECSNDTEYMFVKHEKAVHHSLFCNEHRKSI